jgi:hypothetical protein
MVRRRQILTKIVLAVAGAIYGAVNQVSAEENYGLSVDFVVANQNVSFFSVENVSGEFPGDGAAFVESTGEYSVKMEIQDTEGLAPDARTTFEAPVVISNLGSETVDVYIDPDQVDASTGPDGVIDVRYDSNTVLDSGGVVDNNVTIDPLEEIPLTIEIDFMNHDETSITGEFVARPDDGGGNVDPCAITTATANEKDTLDSLRRFRDQSLSNTLVGRKLVSLYYWASPPVARTLAAYPEGLTARTVRQIVGICAELSDRQNRSSSTASGAGLAVVMTVLYIGGFVLGVSGHLVIRFCERLGLLDKRPRTELSF